MQRQGKTKNLGVAAEKNIPVNIVLIFWIKNQVKWSVVYNLVLKWYSSNESPLNIAWENVHKDFNFFKNNFYGYVNIKFHHF